MMTAVEAKKMKSGDRVRIRDGGGAPWCLDRTYEVLAIVYRHVGRHEWSVSFNGHAINCVHDATICIGSRQSGIFDISLETS